MNYRPEIDGLRTIAVIPVVLFHAGFGAVGGGFVGVDIFFVISGFLITTIIASDLETGHFSFRNFYERRARRILPAILTVAMACIPLAWMWMLPDQFSVFAGSLFANSLFLSNFYFMTQIEYFQPAAELQPLLHTWSLSIEEQYYLVFPALIVFLWKLGRWPTFGALALLVLCGAYLAHVGVTDDLAKNYFHSGARLWEIGIGSLAAIVVLNRKRPENPWLAAVGLGLISWAVFGFDDRIPFPSLYTLVPVIGTVMVVLCASADRGVGRILSHPAMVGLGLLSYSAYLWHQPLFAFARLRSIDPLSPLDALVLAVASFVLAYVTWRFVENPFRLGAHKLIPSGSKFMTLSLGAAVLIATFGLAGYMFNGFPARSHNGVDLAALDQRLAINAGLDMECTSGVTKAGSCQTAPEVDVILWGDSYAMHLVPGLLAANPELRMAQRTMSGCAPLSDLVFMGHRFDPAFSTRCVAFNTEVLEQLTVAEPLRVILSSEFSLNEKTLWQTDGTQVPSDRSAARLEAGLTETIARLEAAGHEVFLISPPPESGRDIGQCLSKMVRFDEGQGRCDFDRSTIVNSEIFRVMDAIATSIHVVRLDEAICSESQCKASDEDLFIYRDKGHLSIEGSVYLGKSLGVFNIIFTQQ